MDPDRSAREINGMRCFGERVRGAEFDEVGWRANGELKVLVVAIAAMHTWPSPAWAQPAVQGKRWFVDGELHSTSISGILDAEPLQMSYGVSARAVRRKSALGCSVGLDTTWWGSPEVDDDDPYADLEGTPQGIVALSLGVERLYFQGRMRFLWDAGASVLLRETDLESRGRVGVVTSFRPVGIRLGRRSPVVIDPLSFSLLIPEVSGIPLVLIQFRTVFAVELGVRENR